MDCKSTHTLIHALPAWASTLVVFSFASLAPGVIWAQASTAQINGTVRDASGLAVPGAEVKATETDTGAARTVTSGADGNYVVPNLPVGPYQLDVTKAGFARFTQSGIVLQVAANPTIDVGLKVGAVSDQVLVEANATQVETQATGIGQVIDNQRVLELPLNARNSQQLIILAGAAVAGGGISSARGYPVQLISVGGGLNNALTYVLDGGTHMDPYIDVNLPLPFPDALQEFKVETSSVPAQYGQHAAGAVEAITKSGTNSFHGTAFEFLRNAAFNSRNAFAPVRDGLKRNQFGGVVGGPIIKNKLFFFGGDQSTLVHSAPTQETEFIPTTQMLAGDWTTITSPLCSARGQITLKAPFVSNHISPSLFSPVALNIMSKLTPSTDPCGAFKFSQNHNSTEHIIDGRVDFLQSVKNSLFGRYMIAHLATPTDYDGKDLLSVQQPNYVRQSQSFALGDTYLISSSIVSSFHATFLRTSSVKSLQNFYSWSDLGVQGLYTPTTIPKIGTLTVSGAFTLYTGSPLGGKASPGKTNGMDYQLAEDLSMTHGAHQIGFGANYVHANVNYLSGTNAMGVYTVKATNTGLAMGDFMLGDASNFTQGQLVTWYPRQHYGALYLQDTWKVSSRLSVISGIRWEPYIPPTTLYTQSGIFGNAAYIQGLHSKVYPNAPAGLLFSGDPGVPGGNALDSYNWGHIAPRLGLAWDPKGDGRMVVRAAWGKFYDYNHIDTYGDLQNSPPTGGTVALPGVNLGNPYGGYAGGNPFPLSFSNPKFLAQSTYLTVPVGLKHPYINQWNLAIQKQLQMSWLLSATYMGSLGVHENQGYEGNPAIYISGNCAAGQYGLTAAGPCSTVSNENSRRLLALENPTQGSYFSNIETVGDSGTRSYNALVLSAQRRATRGFTVLANYTWSHCIDFGGSTNTNVTQAWDPNRLAHDRGNCELDRRHNFNLSTVYQAPEFSNRVARLLVSGWQVSGVVSILSGPWLTVLSSLDNALTGTTDQFPNATGISPYAPNRGILHWLNTAAFSQPAVGTYGNSNPQNVTGPGSIEIDMALVRTFKILEKTSVMFRAEAFNLPNHLNPGNPVVDFSSNNFGQILLANDPRIMQMALKYIF